MRKILTLLALMCTVMAVAQSHHERIKCVQYDNTADAQGARMKTSSQETAPLKSIGSPEIVVCLAEYSDVKFTCATGTYATHEDLLNAVKDSFEIFFNGRGETVSLNDHSVYEYFNEMSMGQFTPHFNIVTGVTVDKNQAYYSHANGSARRTAFMSDALTKFSPIIKDDVDKYDWNKDGKVDGVIIVFPDYGQNIVSDNKSMHPCCWPTGYTYGGVTYATELIAPELYDNESKNINSYGVFVHEMSHMLGLPDFYDTGYKNSGMDYWSLMDYGEYWTNGYRPTPYTAYERMYMHWYDPIELTEPKTITDMKSIGEGGDAYIIYNERNRDEYYILENLSKNYEWSRSQCTSLGSGLIIYHVTYDASEWANTTVNNSLQRMTIIPANGHFEIADNFNTGEEGTVRWISELRGHLWPLKSSVESIVKYYGLTEGNDSLTDYSHRTETVVEPAIDRVAPGATLNTANKDGKMLMHKPITDITYNQAAYTCDFKFMGGDVTAIDELLGDENENENKNRHGLYMYNNRLIIIKDGKKYNMSGQIVR